MGELRRKTPIKRGGRLKPRNNRRKRKADARNFGEEAGRVRGMSCLCNAGLCDELVERGELTDDLESRWCAPTPLYNGVQAAHVTARGMGAVKGGRFDLVPLCGHHHSEAGEAGTSQRADFEKRYGLDLRAEADRIAMEHPAPLGIRGLARRWVEADDRARECLYGRSDIEKAVAEFDAVSLDTHETEALLGWVRRRMASVPRADGQTEHGHRWVMVESVAAALGVSTQGGCECTDGYRTECVAFDEDGCCFSCGADPYHDENGEPSGPAWTLGETAGWPC